MKIGVVTYWYGNSNYGMIMQCWALQQYLKKMGHEPYVIRYQPERPWYIRLAKWCLKYLLCAVSSKHRAALKQEKYNAIKDKERGFDEFRKQHLDFSARVYKNIRELRKKPPVADCYIAGSDQIWCVDLVKDKNAQGYYLSFGDKKIKRIAYAPSFGHMQYDKNNEHLLTKALSGFDYVSCRENNGVEICRRLGVPAQKVVDPTLLLEIDDFKRFCHKADYKDYIFIYSVNISRAEDLYWESIKAMFPGKKVVVTQASGSFSGGELFGKEVEYAYETPSGWLSLINNADLVITSSFHGVVFSIIFNKRFLFVPIKGRFSSTNDRIYDLLKSLDLMYFVVSCPDDYKRIQNERINWGEVNNKKKCLIGESEVFLAQSLINEHE